MLDLVLAGAAVALLVAVAVALTLSERLKRGSWLAGAIALIVLAAGTFAVTLYRGTINKPGKPEESGQSAAATQRFGTAILKVEVPLGTGDKLPQGALWLDPPRPGTDPYTGDVSLLCVTSGKTEHDQNCSGADPRTWTISPLAGRATLAPATGDPFADPAACDPANGVTFGKDYLMLEEGKGYCLRRSGDTRTYALRAPKLPAERPLPTRLNVEVAVLS